MKVLLVEDQPLCRDALIDMLGKRLGEVRAECVDGVDEALAIIRRSPPRLIIADFATGDVCGQPGLEGLIRAAEGAVVATLDTRPIASHARRAQRAGAQAYIPKTSSPELIDAALGVVLAGGRYFPELGAAIADAAPSPQLSPRQSEVLDLVQKGLRNSEIAAALGISVATVKLHVHAILKAMGARSRTDLLLRKMQAGL